MQNQGIERSTPGLTRVNSKCQTPLSIAPDQASKLKPALMASLAILLLSKLILLITSET